MHSSRRMALLGSVVLLSGCASTPLEPSTEMTKAQSAIDQADRAGAREYATDELNSSVQKMAQGQAAATKGEKAQSEQLFEESYADAHLAQISAQSAKVRQGRRGCRSRHCDLAE